MFYNNPDFVQCENDDVDWELIELREKDPLILSDAQKTTLNAVVGKMLTTTMKDEDADKDIGMFLVEIPRLFTDFLFENLHIATPVMFQEDILNGHFTFPRYGGDTVREFGKFVELLVNNGIYLRSTIADDPIDDLKDFQKILLVEYARFLLQKTKEKKE